MPRDLSLIDRIIINLFNEAKATDKAPPRAKEIAHALGTGEQRASALVRQLRAEGFLPKKVKNVKATKKRYNARQRLMLRERRAEVKNSLTSRGYFAPPKEEAAPCSAGSSKTLELSSLSEHSSRR